MNGRIIHTLPIEYDEDKIYIKDNHPSIKASRGCLIEQKGGTTHIICGKLVKLKDETHLAILHKHLQSTGGLVSLKCKKVFELGSSTLINDYIQNRNGFNSRRETEEVVLNIKRKVRKSFSFK